MQACMSSGRAFMKKHPIHQNLSTSFVDLPSLIRHLRGLQFVGTIRVELASYVGEIIFTGSPKLRAREHDHIAGRIAMGEKALVRILGRAREPFGRIHVFQSVDGRPECDVYIDERIKNAAWETIVGRCDRVALGCLPGISAAGYRDKDTGIDGLLNELVGSVEASLEDLRLDFRTAFSNACSKIARRHPVFGPTAGKMDYVRGNLSINREVDPVVAARGVCMALRVLLRRLRKEPRLARAAETARNELVLLALRRQKEYERHSISRYIDRLIGLD